MPDALDELFTVAPQQFVAARNHLAKVLRAEGRRAEAATVAKLRRPTASVWALNQLARREPDRVADLLDAGADLPAAQEALLAGDAERFRSAVRRHRQLLSALATRGAELVTEAEVSATDQQSEILEDLRAASTITEARELFRQGRLSERPEALGDPETGVLGLGSGDAPARPARRERNEPSADEVERERQRVRRADLDRELDQARRYLDEARSEYQQHQDEVADAEASLERARRRLEGSSSRLTGIEDRVRDLEGQRARLGPS